MTNSLFQPRGNNPLLQAIKTLKGMSGGNSMDAYNFMHQREYQSNPQYRQFADAFRGKSPEQAFNERGYDFMQVLELLR